MKDRVRGNFGFFVGMAMFLLSGCASTERERNEFVPGSFEAGDTNVVVSLIERPFWQVTSKRTGKTIHPGVDFYADGRCSIRRWNGIEVEHQISKETVTELSRKLQESGFFQMSTAKIDQALNKEQLRQGTMRFVTDHAETTIVARTPNITNSVEQYAIDWSLKTYPQVKELRAFFDCMRHIHEAAGETENHVWRMREERVRRWGDRK